MHTSSTVIWTPNLLSIYYDGSNRVDTQPRPVSDLRELGSYREMLEETIGIVRRKKEEGMSLEKIKSEGFPPKYDDWGKGYMNAEGWIENIYRSLP